MKSESYGSPSQSIQWDIPFPVSLGPLGIGLLGEVGGEPDCEEEEDEDLVEEEDMDDEECE